jgi:hypothetical protein
MDEDGEILVENTKWLNGLNTNFQTELCSSASAAKLFEL